MEWTSYDTLRKNWRAYLLGGTGEDLDLSGAATGTYIRNLDREACGYWNSLGKGGAYSGCVFPGLVMDPDGADPWFGDANKVRSGNMGATLQRLAKLSMAWATRGCAVYHDGCVLDEIIRAADYVVDHYFQKGRFTNRGAFGNWYHWEITCPTALGSIAMVLYDELGAERVERYARTIQYYAPCCDKGGPNSNGPGMTGGNLLLKAIGVAQAGILLEDETMLANVKAGTRTMDMVSGRDITRSGHTDRTRTADMLDALLGMRGTFPTGEQNRRFDEMMKFYLSLDPGCYYSRLSSISAVQTAHGLMRDSTIRPRSGYRLTRTFAMDRTVHHTGAFSLGIAMQSTRTFAHEIINSEGKRTWNIANGMVFLYDGDEDQYGGGYWATVDPTRLPGTTAEHVTLADGCGSLNANLYAWTGGASLGNNGVAGMHMRALSRHDAPEPYTAGPRTGADTGYCFPEAITLQVMKDTRTGNWAEQGTTTGTETDTYATFYVDHGANPADAGYAYVLLPGRSAAETAAYAAQPDIEILKHDGTVHAARDNSQHILAANFWQAGTLEYLTVSAPASVIVQRDGDRLTIGVSDPTQRDVPITVTLAMAGELVSKDDRVTVDDTTSLLRFTVDTTGGLGGTCTAAFRVDEGN